MKEIEPQDDSDHKLLFTKVILAYDEKNGFCLVIENRDNYIGDNNISNNLKKAISDLSFVSNDFEFIEKFKISKKLNQPFLADFAVIRIKI